MTTNADMTVYHKTVDLETRLDAYVRYPVYGVLWEEKKAVNISRVENGLEDADAVMVYVQTAHMEGITVDRGDIIVRGICEKEISSSCTVAKLQREYTSAVVTSVDKKDFGSPSMHHYEIGGR